MQPASLDAPSPDSPSLLSPAPRPAAPPRTFDHAAPPTYAETQAASPSSQRFTRWGDWVDKRARERHRPDPRTPSSLNPDPALTPRTPPEPHQDHLSTSSIHDPTRPRSTSAASSSSAPGPRSTLRLSRNSLLDRIGSRFDQGIPDEPLCAAPLPTSYEQDDRLILVGTANGLYLVDLAPVSASAPLSTSARSPTDALTHCLWHGVGVHHLDVHVDGPDAASRRPTRSDARAPSGYVVALVDAAHERQVRTWSLEALVKLAMWRAMDEHSVPLELDAAHFSPGSAHSKHAHGYHRHHDSSSSAAPSSAASPTTSRRHPTFPFLHKSSHASPDKAAQAQASSSPSSSAAPSATTSRQSLHPLDVGLAPALGPHLPPVPAAASASASSGPAAHLEQPFEWATSCTALSVPKGGGTVVSCRLFRMPPPPASGSASARSASSPPPRSAGRWPDSTSSGDADSDSDDDGYDDGPSARARAERERRRAEAQRVLLVVVGSARSVFVYEMGVGAYGAGEGAGAGGHEGGGGRGWKLTREFFAPSTPRFLNLVRTTSPPAPPLPPLRATTSRPPPSSSYTPSTTGPAYPPDLHLVIGTSHRVVLVSLATAAVHEVDLPPPASTSPSISSSRRRAGSAASSRSEPAPGSSTSSSSALGPSLGHRKTPSRAAAAAVLGLGELRKSLSALVGSVGVGGAGARAGGAGAGAVPAGMHERELGGLVAGRRVDEAHVGAREVERAGERERARWSGCDVVAVHGPGVRSDRRSTSPRSSSRSALVLLTRGSTSYLVPSLPCPAPLGAPDPPLGLLDRSPSSPSSSPSGAGPPDPLALDVRHAFHHALAPVRRVVALVPRAASGSSGAGRGRETLPLVVCAFAETGIAVQEWGVSPSPCFVAPLGAAGQQQQQLGEDEQRQEEQEEEEDDEDGPPPDAATLDFARATRFLCVLGGEGSGSGMGEGAGTGALFAIEGRGEWVLQRLSVRP